jgi:hypothetical protein
MQQLDEVGNFRVKTQTHRRFVTSDLYWRSALNSGSRRLWSEEAVALSLGLLIALSPLPSKQAVRAVVRKSKVIRIASS